MPDINQINVNSVNANANDCRRSSDTSNSSDKRSPSDQKVQSFQKLMKQKLKGQRDEDNNNNGLLALPVGFMSLLTAWMGTDVNRAALSGGDVKIALADAFIQAAIRTLGETGTPPNPLTHMNGHPDRSLHVRMVEGQGQLSGVEVIVAAQSNREENKRKSKDKKMVHMTIRTQNDEQRQVFESVQSKLNPSDYRLDIQIDPAHA